MAKNNAAVPVGDLLTREQLAAELKFPEHLIDHLRRSGKIPFFSLGYRTVRFDSVRVRLALARLEVRES